MKSSAIAGFLTMPVSCCCWAELFCGVKVKGTPNVDNWTESALSIQPGQDMVGKTGRLDTAPNHALGRDYALEAKTYGTQPSITPAVNVATATVMLSWPAAVILKAVAAPANTASRVNEVLAVAARTEVALDPATVPTEIVAEPPEVTAVEELITAFAGCTKALAGMLSLMDGVMAPIAPPSTAKL